MSDPVDTGLERLGRIIEWARDKGLELHEAEVAGIRIAFTDRGGAAPASGPEPKRPPEEGWEPDDTPENLYDDLSQRFGVRERVEAQARRRALAEAKRKRGDA